MKRASIRRFALLLPILAIGAACDVSKSSNPLSPSVAGPIPGVNITAPNPVDPAQASKIADTNQPVTLTVENGTSNGVRPLTYLFELAADSGFTNKLYSRDGIAPGNGRTSFKLPDALQTGRTYYWRARAQDGANTSPYSPALYFEVYTPVVIDVPTPLSPVGGMTVSTLTPEFRVRNAARSGPVGTISYRFEAADNEAFAGVTGSVVVPEQSGETAVTSPIAFTANKTYFWHARAFDSNNVMGPWSATQVFKTPAPAPSPSPSPGPSPGPAPTVDCDPHADCTELVRQIKAQINPPNTPEGAFEVTKRVAWALRGKGVGLLIKDSGENIVNWKGYWFAAARVCFPDGHIYKILSDVPATNGPSWQDNDYVDPSRYVAAMDPNS